MPSNIDLETSNNNVDILSLKFTKVYTKAMIQLKQAILDKIVENDKSEYNIDKIIEIVSEIYNIPLKIIVLNECPKEIKITKLKNTIINVVDDYYISIK